MPTDTARRLVAPIRRPGQMSWMPQHADAALSMSLRTGRTGVLRPHSGLGGNDPAYAKVDVAYVAPLAHPAFHAGRTGLPGRLEPQTRLQAARVSRAHRLSDTGPARETGVPPLPPCAYVATQNRGEVQRSRTVEQNAGRAGSSDHGRLMHSLTARVMHAFARLARVVS